MRGRKRLPTAVKHLRGTLRTRRQPGDEPTASQTDPGSDSPSSSASRLSPTPPPELDGDSVARAAWRQLIPMLSTARIVTIADRMALIALTLEWSTYTRAKKLSRRGNLTVKRGSGGLGVAPAVAVASRSLQALLRLWPELRMTPHARSTVPIDGPEPGGDSFSEFDQPFEDRRPH